MKNYIAGGASGAIAGFIAGVLFALLSQEYSVISIAALACVVGILPGIWLGKGYRYTTQANFIRRWALWFFLLGLIPTLPISSMYALAALFGFWGVSEYQPASDFILATIFFVIAGGITGAVGGLVGGLLFQPLHKRM